MRHLHKEWRDRAPFTRRVRWYQDHAATSIRLEFTDSDGEVHRFYSDPELASRDWRRFRDGVSTTILRSELRAAIGAPS